MPAPLYLERSAAENIHAQQDIESGPYREFAAVYGNRVYMNHHWGLTGCDTDCLSGGPSKRQSKRDVKLICVVISHARPDTLQRYLPARCKSQRVNNIC